MARKPKLRLVRDSDTPRRQIGRKETWGTGETIVFGLGALGVLWLVMRGKPSKKSKESKPDIIPQPIPPKTPLVIPSKGGTPYRLALVPTGPNATTCNIFIGIGPKVWQGSTKDSRTIQKGGLAALYTRYTNCKFDIFWDKAVRGNILTYMIALFLLKGMYINTMQDSGGYWKTKPALLHKSKVLKAAKKYLDTHKVTANQLIKMMHNARVPPI